MKLELVKYVAEQAREAGLTKHRQYPHHPALWEYGGLENGEVPESPSEEHMEQLAQASIRHMRITESIESMLGPAAFSKEASKR